MTAEAKADLWLYPGDPKQESEPEKTGCPKQHIVRKDLQNPDNCKRCLRTKTAGSEGLLSEWRDC